MPLLFSSLLFFFILLPHLTGFWGPTLLLARVGRNRFPEASAHYRPAGLAITCEASFDFVCASQAQFPTLLREDLPRSVSTEVGRAGRSPSKERLSFFIKMYAIHTINVILFQRDCIPSGKVRSKQSVFRKPLKRKIMVSRALTLRRIEEGTRATTR